MFHGTPSVFPVISLFRPVIFRRFPAFALISLQIFILPAPIYRDLQGRNAISMTLDHEEPACGMSDQSSGQVLSRRLWRA